MRIEGFAAPFEALQCWYRISFEIFRKSPDMFWADLLKN
jgi:hypothetical protein